LPIAAFGATCQEKKRRKSFENVIIKVKYTKV
jgi:hypothetical protein